MHLFQLMGYCPIANRNSQAESYMIEQGIKTDYLGYEVLANVDNLPGYNALSELTHELLIRFGLYSLKEFPLEELKSELVECVQGFLARSMDANKDQPRSLELQYLTNLLTNNKDVLLNLGMVRSYYLQTFEVKDETSQTAINLYRKIEFSVYMLLVAAQTSIIDSFNISQNEHVTFMALPSGQTDKRAIFARCFHPLKYRVDYGQSWLGKPSIKYDKWLTEKILPTDITRAPFPQDNESLVSISQFREMAEELTLLVRDPSAFIDRIKSMTKSQDHQDFRKAFFAVLFGIFMWKDGLALFGWVPIFGELFSFLGNGALGRSLGVIGFMYLIKDVEFRLSLKMIFQKENLLGSLVLLGILLGTIFTI